MVFFYLPSVYVIEVYGINRALTVSSLLTSVGLWLAFAEMSTWGGILINLGMPFVVNCTTKIGGAWFGPRVRNIATMLMIASVYSSVTVNEFFDAQFAEAV